MLEKLPFELVELVLNKLDVYEQIKVAFTCKRLYKYISIQQHRDSVVKWKVLRSRRDWNTIVEGILDNKIATVYARKLIMSMNWHKHILEAPILPLDDGSFLTLQNDPSQSLDKILPAFPDLRHLECNLYNTEDGSVLAAIQSSKLEYLKVTWITGGWSPSRTWLDCMTKVAMLKTLWLNGAMPQDKWNRLILGGVKSLDHTGCPIMIQDPNSSKSTRPQLESLILTACDLDISPDFHSNTVIFDNCYSDSYDSIATKAKNIVILIDNLFVYYDWDYPHDGYHPEENQINQQINLKDWTDIETLFMPWAPCGAFIPPSLTSLAIYGFPMSDTKARTDLLHMIKGSNISNLFLQVTRPKSHIGEQNLAVVAASNEEDYRTVQAFIATIPGVKWWNLDNHDFLGLQAIVDNGCYDVHAEWLPRYHFVKYLQVRPSPVDIYAADSSDEVNAFSLIQLHEPTWTWPVNWSGDDDGNGWL